MVTKILKVLKCGEMFSVKSEKAEGGSLNKRHLLLQELGGQYEDQYLVSLLGNMAQQAYSEGDILATSLRFMCREYNGQFFQDITATEIAPWRK